MREASRDKGKGGHKLRWADNTYQEDKEEAAEKASSKTHTLAEMQPRSPRQSQCRYGRTLTRRPAHLRSTFTYIGIHKRGITDFRQQPKQQP